MLFVSDQEFESQVSKRAADLYEQVLKELEDDLEYNFVQKVYAMQLCVDFIESTNDPKEIVRKAGTLKDLSKFVENSMRRITNMVPYSLMEGRSTLSEELKRFCSDFHFGEYTRISFKEEGIPLPVGKMIQTHSARIVRTLIHYASKSTSHRLRIRVALLWQQEMFAIEIEDNMPAPDRQLFIRLLGESSLLKMRSQAIGASLEYGKEPGDLLAKLRVKV